MKEKKIEDYIHHHLGCEVETPTRRYRPEGGKSYKAVGKIMDIDLVINQVGIHFPEEDIHDLKNYPFDQIKLLLRPLSSMTEDEVRELAIIYSGDNECKRVDGTASNWWYFQCFIKENTDHTLVISTSGEAWYRHYFDRDSTGHRNTVNHHEATRYLLSKGFDLFELIPAKLALDKTLVKN